MSNDGLIVASVYRALKNKHRCDFVIDGVSFALPKGMIMGLIGANGSGKTSLVKMLVSLYFKQKGTITFEGNTDFKASLAYIPDDFPFPDHYTVTMIETLMKSGYSTWDSVVFRQYIDKYDVPYSRKVKALSQGLRQRLMLAISLSHQARLLIFDEPFENLDPFIQQEITDDIRTYVYKQEATVLIATHQMHLLENFADYLGFMEAGCLRYFMTSEELFDTFGSVGNDNEAGVMKQRRSRRLGYLSDNPRARRLVSIEEFMMLWKGERI